MIGSTRTPIVFPLNTISRVRLGQALGVPPLMGATSPLPAVKLIISGITKNSAGAALGSCTVELFQTATDLPLEKLVSDASTGAYAFSSVGLGQTYYIVAYKAGSPDVAGTTVNTLVGV